MVNLILQRLRTAELGEGIRALVNGANAPWLSGGAAG